ncbi:MAG: ATP-binding protein [Limnohabitans sp.]|nr:ATP-binding protein [Limnohabitans sp.]
MSSKDEQIVFSVEDRGPGIPEQIKPYLFNEYIPNNDYAMRPQSGAGLGLLLSQKWARLLGGGMGYSNKADQWSLFYISVPVRHIQTEVIS